MRCNSISSNESPIRARGVGGIREVQFVAGGLDLMRNLNRVSR